MFKDFYTINIYYILLICIYKLRNQYTYMCIKRNSDKYKILLNFFYLCDLVGENKKFREQISEMFMKVNTLFGLTFNSLL